MAVIKRSAIAAPTLPKETVAVAPLGGDVVVRGLLLTERMAVQRQLVELRKKELTDTGAVHAILPVMLALCVLDAEGLPLFTQDQWQAFGATHTDTAVELFNTAWRLSGFAQADDTKN